MLFWCSAEEVGKTLLSLLTNGVGMLALGEGLGMVAALEGLHLKSAWTITLKAVMFSGQAVFGCSCSKQEAKWGNLENVINFDSAFSLTIWAGTAGERKSFCHLPMQKCEHLKMSASDSCCCWPHPSQAPNQHLQTVLGASCATTDKPAERQPASCPATPCTRRL